MHLGREHDVVTPAAGQRLADDDLRLTLRVDVGSVDEVDPGIQRLVDDPDALVVILVAPFAEHHGAEAQLADPDARASKKAILHKQLPGAGHDRAPHRTARRSPGCHTGAHAALWGRAGSPGSRPAAGGTGTGSLPLLAVPS